MNDIEIVTNRLLLRPFRIADAKDLKRLAGDFAISDTTFIPHPYEEGFAEKWITQTLEKTEAGSLVVFAITTKINGLLTGSIGMTIDNQHNRGEIAYWIAKENWGLGYCTEAVNAILKYGFTQLGLNRIQSNHFVRNPASGRVLLKAGMSYEGLARQYFKKGDTYEDANLYGITKADWYKYRTIDKKSAYFDSIASLWDSWQNYGHFLKAVEPKLKSFGISPDESVLDVGCGTGNLTGVLAKRLGCNAKITAIDISSAMINIAKLKNTDPRITWKVQDISSTSFEGKSFDRIFCYSIWPHINNYDIAAGELSRILRSGGYLHIWHTMSRANVNSIHEKGGAAIQKDLLPPAEFIASILENHSFTITNIVDNDEQYLVTGIKRNHDEEKLHQNYRM